MSSKRLKIIENVIIWFNLEGKKNSDIDSKFTEKETGEKHFYSQELLFNGPIQPS